MNWQKVDDMPYVKAALAEATRKIEMSTGITIKFSLTASRAFLSDYVKYIVAEHFGVSKNDIDKHSRLANLVNARHAYMYIMYTSFGFNYSEIAKSCGNRHHTTALIAVDKINNFYAVGDDIIADIEAIKTQLRNKKIA